MIGLAFFFAIGLTTVQSPAPETSILGSWTGIDVFQDKASYDGKTIYLPNEEEMIVSENRIRVYNYPHFKVDDFTISLRPNQIVYQVNRNKTVTNYSFNGDTLVFEMNFINKRFLKLYVRKELDPAVIDELDEFGFNPSSLQHEFEIDTFHQELRSGFSDFNELNYKPYQYLQFKDDSTIQINRGDNQRFVRGYQTLTSYSKDDTTQFKIYHSEGTQGFSIIPTSLCQCDTIVIPYLTTAWANRKRQKIIDWENY